MRPALLLPCLALLTGRPAAAQPTAWRTETRPGYVLHYPSAATPDLPEYRAQLDAGVRRVQQFFGESLPRPVDIYFHPTRAALDQQWQKDWQMPTFRSECWMVASGVGTRLDALVPRQWDTEACDHRFADKTDTERLLAHELVHVYHGQHNPSPDFGAVEGLDWLVEGLGTYAAGQVTAARVNQVRDLIADDKAPTTLDGFWTGPAKYGLAGTLVQLVDQRYGRAKLKEVLKLTTRAEVLAALHVTEEKLLAQWRGYVREL